MKFSIIIPTFNSEEYLRKTIESILNQNYNNVEILIADGGSQDKTLEIAKSYNSVKIVSTKDNGQTDGINKAYKFVTGDIVAWQNSDDIYCNNSFFKVAEAFTDNSIDITYGDYVLIDENDKTVRICKSHQWNPSKFKTGRFVPLQPTVFWRKKVSDSIFPLDVDLFYCMDVDFFAKANLQGFKFHYIQEELGKFRMHARGKTSQFKDTRKVLGEHARTLNSNYNLDLMQKIMLFKNLTKIYFAKLYLNLKTAI
jgi:glycosyltransferase involved in cell wall biosynthesis